MTSETANKVQELKVNIRSRNKTYFNSSAHSVTSKNEKGDFDVLPLHANFVTLVVKSIIIDKGLTTEFEIPIDKGVLYVRNDQVDGYVGV